VLSAAPQLPYGDDEARTAAAARYVNDEYAALVSTHPDRFRAFAATPMPHIDAALTEISRAIDELGMVGLTMNTSILDRAITDPEFEPVFAELDRRGAILYLHPVGNGACSPLVSEHHITWMVGAPFEDTIAAMQLNLRTSAEVSRGQDHLLASRGCAADDSAAGRRPRPVGGT
jgi:6-methylsalicylate decarboxylase